MNEITNRVYALMEERGVNARRVSRELELSNSAFTDWKNSKHGPGVEALVKLAAYFGVSLDYLITGRENNAAVQAEIRRREFYAKIARLTPFGQGRVAGYIDAMLDEAKAEERGKQKKEDMAAKEILEIVGERLSVAQGGY